MCLGQLSSRCVGLLDELQSKFCLCKHMYPPLGHEGTVIVLRLSPHTGVQEYQDGVPKIPTACITVEDAEMMSRMVSRGSRIVIQLKMGAKNYPDADSFNTVAEITGSKYPEQVSEQGGWAVWE